MQLINPFLQTIDLTQSLLQQETKSFSKDEEEFICVVDNGENTFDDINLCQKNDASSIAPLGALGKSFERSFNQWRLPNYSGDFNSQLALFAVIFHLFKKMYHSIFGFSDFDNKAKEEVYFFSNFGVGFFDVPKQQNDQQSLSANTFNLQIK
ncbi:MAG: hypothetical protein ACE365_00255 [Gammaproteobacteria bacterium]